MKVFDGFRLVLYIFGGVFGLAMLLRGCDNQHALKTTAKEDFLILMSTTEKSVSRGRFQASGKEVYARGRLASTGTYHELKLHEACAHIDCEGFYRCNRAGLPKPATRVYRAPVWSADNGRVISPRKPGDTAVDLGEVSGEITGGFILFAVIFVPILLVVLIRFLVPAEGE